MANLLKSGGAWLASQMEEHASETVTVDNGVDAAISVSARLGRTEHMAGGEFDNLRIWKSVDWVVNADDLDFGSGAVLPEQGWLIRYTVDGTVFVYEAQPLADNTDVYRTSLHEQRIRIHTKLIDTE